MVRYVPVTKFLGQLIMVNGHSSQMYCKSHLNNFNCGLQVNKRKVDLVSGTVKSKRDFSNVIIADKCTIQLDCHSHLCFQKKNQSRTLKQRAKHPVKLHIWGGISKQGATNIIMFAGIMNAERLRLVFEAGLLPNTFPDGHRDNDPKTL